MAACVKCVFFEKIDKHGKPVYTLCHLTGEKNPDNACHNFRAGEWAEIDRVLGIERPMEAEWRQLSFELAR